MTNDNLASGGSFGPESRIQKEYSNVSSSRVFELFFIVDPNLDDETIEKIVGQLTNAAAERGGKIAKVEKRGRRALAYEIRKGSRKFREGYDVLLTIEGSGAEIAEMERRLRVQDPVIRYLTVRVDEDLKRAKKVQDRRASKRPKVAAEEAGAEEAASAE